MARDCTHREDIGGLVCAILLAIVSIAADKR